MKKIICTMIAAILFATPFVSSNIQANATEQTNMIDSMQITHRDGTTGGNFDYYEESSTVIKWSDKTNNLHAGDTFTFNIPNNLAINGMSFPLLTADNQEAGTVVYDAVTRIGTVTFNDYVNGRADVAGTIRMSTYFSLTESTSEQVVPISFTVNGTTITTDVTVNPTPTLQPDELLDKWGNIMGDSTNTEWIVRVNFAKETINNTSII